MNQPVEFKAQIPSIKKSTSHSDAVPSYEFGALLFAALDLSQ